MIDSAVRGFTEFGGRVSTISPTAKGHGGGETVDSSAPGMMKGNCPAGRREVMILDHTRETDKVMMLRSFFLH